MLNFTYAQTEIVNQEPNNKQIYLIAGNGFPELIHASLGYYFNKKVSLELEYGNVIFNNMIGIGSTYYLHFKNNNFHSILINVLVRTNPNNSPLKLQSGGETLGSMLELYSGYNYCSKKGFLFRAQIGFMTTSENNHFGGGPNTKLGIGYCF